MTRTLATLIVLCFQPFAAAAEKATITMLLPGMNPRAKIKSARVDWWSIKNPVSVGTAAGEQSPIFVVLDFAHIYDERPQCLVEELLPVVDHPAFGARVHVLVAGPSAPFFDALRGRSESYRLLRRGKIDADALREECMRPPDPRPASPPPDFRSQLSRLAAALGYSTSTMMQKWNRFETSRTAIRELVDHIPAGGAPARVFWLTEDFRPFDGPPIGCDDGGTSGEGIFVSPGGNCDGGGLVDRELLYFFLSELTHAGAVITPVAMQHGGGGDPLRERSLAAAGRMAKYTGATLRIADRHPSRSLVAAIEESERWPVAEMEVPVTGMRAVVTQPRRMSIVMSDGGRVTRRFATKEGQRVVESLESEVNAARYGPRYAKALPLRTPMPAVSKGSSERAVTWNSGVQAGEEAWLLNRELELQIKPGCSVLTKPAQELVTLRVPGIEPRGLGPVEVVLREWNGFHQSLRATREELLAGVCFGIPTNASTFRLTVLDAEHGAGGIWERESSISPDAGKSSSPSARIPSQPREFP